MNIRHLMLSGLLLFSLPVMAAQTAAGNDAANTGDAANDTAVALHDATISDAEFMKMLHHANPMPNFMGVVLGNAEKLKLDQNQVRNLEFWRDHKMLPAKKLVRQINELEKSIHTASLDGKPTGYLINQTSRMLSLRMQLASQKILCRDNRMHVLTPEQWSQAVALYKENPM